MSEAELAVKDFPEDYPKDALDIMDAMSFTDGKSVMLLGSMSIRSQQYAGDYDSYEIVPNMSPAELVAKWKVIIKRLRGMKDVYIGDIKCGEATKWRILNADAGVKDDKIVDYNSVASHKRIDALEKDGVITSAEAKEARDMLPPGIKPLDLIKAKNTLKFHVVRWTPDEILAGEKRLRDGSTYTLEEAVQTPALAKMDVIGLVQKNRYTDFSMIYEYHYKNKVLNPAFRDIGDALKEDIMAFTAQGKFFKVLKRVYAYAKFKHKDDVIAKLTPILNSDLGRLYQIASDVGTLIDLLEDKAPVPLEKLHYELDQFKSRLANIYNIPAYSKAHHQIIAKLNGAVKMTSRPQLLARLTQLQEEMLKILNGNAPTAKGLVGGGWLDTISGFFSNLFGSPSTPPPASAPPPEDKKAYAIRKLASMDIHTPKDFKKWSLKFHPDKGGDSSAYATISGLASTAGLIGSGKMPGRDILQKVGDASYKASPPQKIGNLTLLSHTATLKFYKAPDNTIVVGVRGTKDARDVKADAMIATNQLEQSDRYKDDIATMNRFQNSYPKDKFDYYGVGHSLGGAILDSLIHHRYLKNGISYNPAVQYRDLFNTKSRNQRHYTKTDPLGKIFIPMLHTAPASIRDPRAKNWWENIIDYIPVANKAYEAYSGHKLNNFVGGANEYVKQTMDGKETTHAERKAMGVRKLVADMKAKGLPADLHKDASKILTKIFKTDSQAGVPTKFLRYYNRYSKGQNLRDYVYKGYGDEPPPKFSFPVEPDRDPPPKFKSPSAPPPPPKKKPTITIPKPAVARKKPTIPKPDLEAMELAHDPTGRSLLALRVLTTPELARTIRGFTAPERPIRPSRYDAAADEDVELEPRGMNKKEIVNDLFEDAIRAFVFDDNVEELAENFYGYYWDNDWDDDHYSTSSEEGVEKRPRDEAREDRYERMLEQTEEQLAYRIADLDAGAEDPSAFWSTVDDNLVSAWNKGEMDTLLQKAAFRHSLNPKQREAVRLGLREKLLQVRDLRNEVESEDEEEESSEESSEDEFKEAEDALRAELEGALGAEAIAPPPAPRIRKPAIASPKKEGEGRRRRR